MTTSVPSRARDLAALIDHTLLREEVYANVRSSDFTDEQLQQYFESHKDEFVVPEKVQIKRILIKVSEQKPDAEAKKLAAEA